MSQTISLTQGRFTIVDDGDFEWLNQHKWHWKSKPTGTGYAMRDVRENGRWKHIYMHRIILSPQGGREPDHINGDGLDNRRCNLRSCTRSQNNMNSRKRRGCSSRYKGVCWNSRDRKWEARIRVNGRLKQLGYFDDEQEAAAAYDVAAHKLFGQFARVNAAAPKLEFLLPEGGVG